MIDQAGSMATQTIQSASGSIFDVLASPALIAVIAIVLLVVIYVSTHNDPAG